MVRALRTVYVEGGGDSHSRKTEFKKALHSLLGTSTASLKIVASGGRAEAFRKYRTAMKRGAEGGSICLLVDSEVSLEPGRLKWEHVRLRKGDGWEKPKGADEKQIFFMVECMESWLLADKECLEEHFGKGFKVRALPKDLKVEMVSKTKALEGLNRAAKDTAKKGYSKGRDSFAILGKIDPKKLRESAPHAEEFFEWVGVSK